MKKIESKRSKVIEGNKVKEGGFLPQLLQCKGREKEHKSGFSRVIATCSSYNIIYIFTCNLSLK